MVEAKDWLPMEARWRHEAAVGERAVKDALGPKIRESAASGAPVFEGIAMLYGAIVSIAGALHNALPEDRHGELEVSVLAHVRGALRGLDGPVHEDGSPFPGRCG